MITIDGKNWELLSVASKRLGVSHQALRKWLQRHQEVPTKTVATAKLVQLEDLPGYKKRTPRAR